MTKKKQRIQENIRKYIRGMKEAGRARKDFTIRVTVEDMHILFPEFGEFDKREPYQFDGYPIEVV